MSTIVTIPRTKGIRYKAVIRLTGVKPYSKTFTTRRAAEHWAKHQEDNVDLLRAGVDIKALRMTLADLADDYMLNSWKGKDQGRPYHVRWWRGQLGASVVQEITKQQVRAKLREYKVGRVRRYDGVEASGKAKTREVDKLRAPASVNRLRGALEAILKYGREEYDLTADPCAGIPKERENNARKRFLSESECAALLEACRASKWGRLWLLVAMALTSGARQSEMLNLRYCDLDLVNNRAVLLDTKNGEIRRIHLTDEIVAEIQQFPSPLNRDTLLFESHKKRGKPFEFRKLWNVAVKQAGVEIGEGRDRFVFHSLRHTAASFLANQGMSLPEIGAVLGHKSVVSTNRYSHLCDDRANDLVCNVNSKMLRSPGKRDG